MAGPRKDGTARYEIVRNDPVSMPAPVTDGWLRCGGIGWCRVNLDLLVKNRPDLRRPVFVTRIAVGPVDVCRLSAPAHQPDRSLLLKSRMTSATKSRYSRHSVFDVRTRSPPSASIRASAHASAVVGGVATNCSYSTVGI